MKVLGLLDIFREMGGEIDIDISTDNLPKYFTFLFSIKKILSKAFIKRLKYLGCVIRKVKIQFPIVFLVTVLSVLLKISSYKL